MIRSNISKEYMKKAVLTYAPKSITIHITSGCPNKCRFCAFHGEDAKGNSKAYGLPFLMSYDDFVRIVDMANRGGVNRIHICGTGEPFTNPAILDMIDYVIKVHGKVSFQTCFYKKLFDMKGYLDEIVKRADKIEYITTDVCSGDPEEHEYIKQGSSYEELLNALEYIAKRCNVKIHPFLILTRSHHKNIKSIIDSFLERGITNFDLSIGNLFSYDYSEFTSSDNVYISTDYEISKLLNETVEYGKERGIAVSIPQPADKRTEMCNVFWHKLQAWPVQGCEQGRYGENMIPCSCAAVVRGDLNSLGYLFDYDSIMDAWNSPKLVEIRKNLLKGKYPSEYCKSCYCCAAKDSYYKQKVSVKKKYPWIR